MFTVSWGQSHKQMVSGLLLELLFVLKFVLFVFFTEEKKKKKEIKLSFEDNLNCLQWLLSYFWMFYSLFFMLLYFSVNSAGLPLLNQPNFLIIYHQTMHWLMAF